MTYTLVDRGDTHEQILWPLLSNDFVSYETFWQRFIVPLRAEGGGIVLRAGLNPLLESMAMTHYSVFYHLGVASELRSKNGQDQPEDVLFHLSAATEMVEHLIFALAEIDRAVKNGGPLKKFMPDEVMECARRYTSTRDYDKDFERFQTKGQAVHLRLHNVDDITQSFMHGISDDAAAAFKKWQGLANDIRHYRNTVAHDPKLGMLANEAGAFFVPRVEKLHKYELWSSIVNRKNNDDFVPVSDLLSQFQADLLKMTNGLWTYLIDALGVLSKMEAYGRMVGGGAAVPSRGQLSSVTPTIVSTPGNQAGSAVATFAPPSGTFPDDPNEPSKG